jgi:hypothetical protein
VTQTQRGAEPSRPALTFHSSSAELETGFAWAAARSLEWVRTDPAELASYWAGLTDRPMFYSRDVAHQLLGAHLMGLDRENLTMMRHFAASATPARRHYPLWAFLFDGTPAEIDYHGDDDFVRETPAPYELVEKALEQYRWTGDARWVNDPDLARFRTDVVRRFAAEHDVLGIGLAGEAGTGDIFRGSATYNERGQATPPLLGADGVTSQWAALEAVATILPEAVAAGAAAEDGLVGEARAEADRIRAVFEGEWWSPAEQRYASGRTAEHYDTGFSWEPTWFPAVKAIMAPGERADAHLAFLAEQVRATPPSNIEAVTYLPEAFLAYHHDAEARHWIDYLLASRADYPEVPFTAVAHLTVGLSGLRPIGPSQVETDSHLAAGEWTEADGIPIGAHRLAVRQEGRERTTLTVRSGAAAVEWRARFGGAVVTARVEPGATVTLTAP